MMYQRIVAMVRKVSACIASAVGLTSLSRMVGSVQQTSYFTGNRMKQLEEARIRQQSAWQTPQAPLSYGHSKPSFHQSEPLLNMDLAMMEKQIALLSQYCMTVNQPEYGLQEHLTGGRQSTSCHSAVLDQCGTIPDEAARLLYAKTFLAQRGVPKQDMERLLSLAPLSECTTYKHLRQRLKTVSFFYMYSGGSTPIRLDAMRGSNLGLRAVY